MAVVHNLFRQGATFDFLNSSGDKQGDKKNPWHRYPGVFQSRGGDLAQSLGGRNKFSRTQTISERAFPENINILTPKNSDDFFSHRPRFSDFDSLFSHSLYL